MKLSLGEFMFNNQKIVVACDYLNNIKHRRLGFKYIEEFRKE